MSSTHPRRPRLRRAVGVATAVAALAATVSATAQAKPVTQPTDPGPLYSSLDSADSRLFLQTLGRPDGQDMVYRISGKVMNQVRGNAYGAALAHGKTLFGFEGYNIRRLYRVPGTDDLYQLSREIVFYTDPVTGERLTQWTNPLDGRTRPLPPIANEHVNAHYRIKDGKLYTVAGTAEIPLGKAVAPLHIHDKLEWTSDVAPLYSLAQRYGIPEGFGLVNNTYATWEMFDFYVDQDEARKRETKDIPKGAMEIVNSWTRTAPYIPAMCIPENSSQGSLVYHARSWSLDSFDELDPWIKTVVKADYPLFTQAPQSVDPTPNDTTWTSFYGKELKPQGLTWQQWCDSAGS
ncbi:DUF1838 family protein [Kitasatospora sp. NPDC093102]|uniref:DUF1838 family protein n=1 Tax=Kitasatospora sp. NPDC093102 TaxID=3155069 RepID=UPI003445BA0F